MEYLTWELLDKRREQLQEKDFLRMLLRFFEKKKLTDSEARASYS